MRHYSHSQKSLRAHFPQRIYNTRKGNKSSSDQILIRWSYVSPQMVSKMLLHCQPHSNLKRRMWKVLPFRSVPVSSRPAARPLHGLGSGQVLSQGLRLAQPVISTTPCPTAPHSSQSFLWLPWLDIWAQPPHTSSDNKYCILFILIHFIVLSKEFSLSCMLNKWLKNKQMKLI